MSQFAVSGPAGLFAMMVAAFVKERTGCAVAVERPEFPALAAGVRLSASDGRWLYVAPVYGGDSSAVEALAEGASAVLHLGSAPEEFELALRALHAGDRAFVPVDVVRWMAGEALAQRSGSREAVKVTLTQREREILQLVARGYTNQEIAEELTISTNTVRSHLHTLSVKLDATNRTKMLANARALAIPEALEFRQGGAAAPERASA
ncbi:MAG: response regulator transcription factor [Dehalococcoidia bacterium]|nr:response regulator transcription factor [Dehalococcoidia bacterium]